MSGQGKLTTLLTKPRPDLIEIAEYARSNNLNEIEMMKMALKYYTIRKKLNSDLNPLHVACISFSPAAVAALIKEGFDINSGVGKIDSYLRIALDFGNIAVAQMLLKMGADPFLKTNQGKTPIEAALSTMKSEKECLTALQLLVQEAKVPVDAIAVHPTQQRALHVAVTNNLPSAVRFLLQRGADGNATTLHGCTPLHLACYGNFVVIIKHLVSHKVDLYKHNAGNDTPLLIVVREDQREALKALLDGGCDINKLLINGSFSALHCAIDECSLDKVEYLVSLGADPDIRLSNRTGPLHYLALRDKSQNVAIEISKVQRALTIAEFLVEKGASVNVVDNKNKTPLQFAISKKHFQLAKLFIQLGANMDLHLSSNETLFHIVSCINHDIITFFLEFGADYNKKNKACLTPYHTAINSKVNLKYIKSFLQYGCPYDQDHSVWHRTKVLGTNEFSKLYTAEEQFFKGIKENKIKLVKEAVKAGAVPTSTSERCRYPLHYVTSKGYEELVEYLLENAVPANRLNAEGETAFFIAARQGYFGICCTLLQFGACYNYRNKRRSKTPKMIAQEKGHESVVVLLQTVEAMFSLAKNGSKHLIKAMMNAASNSYDEYLMYANAKNNKGCTLLSTSLNMNHSENAKELMELRNMASVEKVKLP